MFKSVNLNSLAAGNSGEIVERSGNLNNNPPTGEKSTGFSKSNKDHKLNILGINLKEEFSRRNLSRKDFVNYCELLHHPIAARTVSSYFNKPWSSLSTVVQVKFLAFFIYVDK